MILVGQKVVITSILILAGFIQVSIGTKECVVGVEDTSSIRIGSLVAVHVADYPPPCIGKVESINNDSTIVVGWLKGGYHKVWSEWMVPDERDQRKKVQWKDTIRRDSILLYDFHLTKCNHLKKETIIYLKKQYESL